MLPAWLAKALSFVASIFPSLAPLLAPSTPASPPVAPGPAPTEPGIDDVEAEARRAAAERARTGK